MPDETMIRKALMAWRENEWPQSESTMGVHLSEDVLYRIAAPGGLQQAGEEELEHLSCCPLCLQEWSSWMESLEICTDDGQTTDVICSVGYLKAAAASLYVEPIRLESACGRFELSVYPDLDSPGQGMVVIEVQRKGEEVENTFCVVRDGKGSVILKGLFEDGRLAGRLPDLSQLDLKTWTVVVSPTR